MPKNTNPVYIGDQGGCKWYGCGSRDKNAVASNAVCPNGTVLVGLDGWDGTDDGQTAALTALQCQPLPDLFAQIKTNILKIPFPAFEPNHGTARSLTLPPGHAVTALLLSSGDVLNKLQLFGTDITALRPNSVSSVSYTDGGTQRHWLSCPANHFAVGINSAQSGEWPSYVSKVSLLCQDQTKQITTLMATLPVPYEDLRKCIGLDLYADDDVKPSDTACAQLTAHYCLTDTQHLLECSTSNFCKVNRTACDAAYVGMCGTAFAAATASAPLSDTDKKVCSCSWENPIMKGVPGYTPVCHNSDCLTPGVAYRTLQMQATQCAPLIVCLNELILNNVKQAQLSGISFSNNCGDSADKAPATTAVKVSGTTTNVTQNGATTSTINSQPLPAPSAPQPPPQGEPVPAPIRAPPAPKIPVALPPVVVTKPTPAPTPSTPAPAAPPPTTIKTIAAAALAAITPSAKPPTQPSVPPVAAPPAIVPQPVTRPSMPLIAMTPPTVTPLASVPPTIVPPAATPEVAVPPVTVPPTAASLAVAPVTATQTKTHDASRIIVIVLLVTILTIAVALGVRKFVFVSPGRQETPASEK